MDPIVVTSPSSPSSPSSASSRSGPSSGPTRLPPSWRWAIVGWIALAMALAGSGAFATVRPLVPIALVAAIAGTIVGWRRSPALRAFTESIDLRLPILFHLVRIGFGALFLVELEAGRLPSYFALRAGVGDIIAGVLAVVAALAAGGRRAAAQPLSGARRALILGWSALGLADIIAVVLTAQYGLFVLDDALLAQTLPLFPYALLPTIVVPLVILTHLLVVQRLWRRRG